MDFDEDKYIPIILGRPFLATERALIDVPKGELTMRMEDKYICFKVFKELSMPSMEEQCFDINSESNATKLSPKGLSPFVIVQKMKDDVGRLAELYLRCVPRDFQNEGLRKKREFEITKLMKPIV